MSEIHGASGSYVVNALEPSEQVEFEAHLAGCDTCGPEIVELRETVSELTHLSAAAPPPALKSQVMAAISTVRVLPPEAPTPDSAAPASQIDQLALRRQVRATRILSVAVAAVLVIALSLGGWVVSLVQHQAPATATMQAQLLQAPDLTAHTVTLKDGGKGTFLASKSMNRAMFSSGDLPALGPDQTYELWTLSGPLTAPTRVTPDSLVTGGATAATWFTGPIADSDAVAISIEKAGGASTPTNIQAATAL